MNTFFTSDQHLGHKKIIDLCGRPFESLEDMQDQIIENYNEMVQDDDVVYFLGDFAFGSLPVQKAFFDRLRGRKLTLRGNHDRSVASLEKIGFEVLTKEPYEVHNICIADVAVKLCHFPYANPADPDQRYRQRRPLDTGGWLLHGHTHSNTCVQGRSIHVGVDAWNFRPVSISMIRNIIRYTDLS